MIGEAKRKEGRKEEHEVYSLSKERGRRSGEATGETRRVVYVVCVTQCRRVGKEEKERSRRWRRFTKQ